VGLIVGGILIAVSPFMAWASVVLLGTFNLFQLLEFDRVNSSNGLWVSAVGVFFVLSGISFPERVRRAVSVVGGALASLAAWGVLEKLVTAIRQAEGFARVEIGPYIALSGSGVVLVAGLVCLLSKPRTPDPNGRRPIPTTAKAQRFTR
jgi:hypothetical protein